MTTEDHHIRSVDEYYSWYCVICDSQCASDNPCDCCLIREAEYLLDTEQDPLR